MFDALADRILPALAARAAEGNELRVWSAGCAAGEEPYTIALLWRHALAPRFPALRARIVATDVDADALARARSACYPPSSLKELPRAWRDAAFAARDGRLCLHDDVRAAVELRCEDLRLRAPDGPFHLILCRNGAFTYFAEPLQRDVAARVTLGSRPAARWSSVTAARPVERARPRRRRPGLYLESPRAGATRPPTPRPLLLATAISDRRCSTAWATEMR